MTRSFARLSPFLVLCLAACSDGGDGIREVPPPAIPAAWRNLYRTPTSSHLRGVRFVNANQGFVVGDSTSIFRTDNGGAASVADIRWYHHEPQPTSRQGDLVKADILAGAAQAVGNDSGGGKFWTSAGALDWYTADAAGAGSPYTNVDVIQADQFGNYSVAFYLRQNGELVGNNTGMSHTASGLSVARGIDFLGVSGEGYVVGSIVGDAVIRKAVNFGRNPGDWSTMPFEPPAFAPTGDFHAVQVVFGLVTVPPVGGGSPVPVQAKTGFAVGEAGLMVVLHEIATGPTTSEFRWKQQATGVTKTLRSVHFPLDHTIGWAVGDDGTILKFTWIPPADPNNPPDPTLFNYTVTNQTIAPATTLDLHDVCFVNQSTGFAVGDAGLVYRTTNGGTTWTLVSGGTLFHVNAVDFSGDGLLGIAVGEGGLVARTLDGGETWSIINAGLSGSNFTGVAVPKIGGGTSAFICADGGRIFRCADITATPGLAWEQCGGAIPNVQLRAIHFAAGGSTGVCVGDDAAGAGPSTVFTTVNGDAATGALVTWTQAAGVPADTDFGCVTGDTGGLNYYVGGAGGAIYTASVVGGLTPWTQVAVPAGISAGTVTSLQAPAGGFLLFAGVGSGGSSTVWRLTTVGLLWSPTALAGGVPVSIAFADQNNGYAATTGTGAGIWRTSNGGTTWARQVIHTVNPLRFIWASPAPSFPDLAYACGENGTILKTVSGGQ
jgi:photosystem II stability/assembly factor-like uncharacterized protein